MEPDKYQQAWKAQASQTRVTVDADLLLKKEVQRNRHDFRAIIVRRDVIEVGVALLLLPYWFYAGIAHSLPWSWYLAVPALVWIAGFLIVHRIRHKQKASEPDEPLLLCVDRSLNEVEDQIWLLRNVVWWYLMPLGISILAFFAHVTWLHSKDWLDALGHGGGLFVFVFALYSFIYWLNQRAVRVQLEPRRQELLALLTSLGDDSTDQRATLRSAKSAESSRMLRRGIVAVSCLVALVMIALASGIFQSRYDQPPKIDGPAGASLGRLITALRKEKKLVGLAAMVTVDGQVEAAAADGERKRGSGVPLQISDRWHLGGITKSITATMIARLVESGQMQWSDAVGKFFPDASVQEDWKPVTFVQLLTDTAGAPANFPKDVLLQRPALGPECTQARRKAVLNVIAEKPAYPPGKKNVYSNVGCTIAAAMAEAATGASWEDLVKRKVFEPLALTEAGFGPPKSADATLEQPRGHRKVLAGKVPMDDESDNTAIMGPSGSIHMTLANLCTYANDHLRGELGTGKLLSRATYKRLHTPELDHYAYGWLRKDPSAEIPCTVYWHNGSNTYWYALVVFAPEKNMVVAVVSNDGDSECAEAAAWEVVKQSLAGDFTRQVALPGADDPKKSPFAAVRWEGSQPEVKVGPQWYKLISLDELSASEIVAFSRRTYGKKWQMRFEEDLVELLTRMGHPPRDTVSLVVRSLTSSETRTLESVPMTEANRRAIKAAARTREPSEP